MHDVNLRWKLAVLEISVSLQKQANLLTRGKYNLSLLFREVRSCMCSMTEDSIHDVTWLEGGTIEIVKENVFNTLDALEPVYVFLDVLHKISIAVVNCLPTGVVSDVTWTIDRYG